MVLSPARARPRSTIPWTAACNARAIVAPSIVATCGPTVAAIRKKIVPYSAPLDPPTDPTTANPTAFRNAPGVP